MGELALKKERIDWIDIAKGIGIILVVMGHLAAEDQDLKRFIYCFHMPLFFFISGIVFNIKNIKFKKFFIKKFKSVYLPYAVFLSADYLVGFVLAIKKYGLSVSLIKDITVSFIKNITGTNVPSGGGVHSECSSMVSVRAVFF